MWRIGLIVVSFVLLTLSAASAHELIFDLPHQHDRHYYENLYYKERTRAIFNYTVTGQPRYMVPYLGWPDRRSKSNDRASSYQIYRSSSGFISGRPVR